MNRGKVGRPYIYPQTFMYFLAFIHVAFLPFRQLEGLLRKLSEYIPRVKPVDYSTICKRLEKLDIELPRNPGENIIVAVDSSGMKVTTSREERIQA